MTSLVSFLPFLRRSDLITMSMLLILLIGVIAGISQSSAGQTAPQMPFIAVSNGLYLDPELSSSNDLHLKHNVQHKSSKVPDLSHPTEKHQQNFDDSKLPSLVFQHIVSLFIILAVIYQINLDTLKWRKSTVIPLFLAITTLTLLSYMPYFISWPSLTSANLAPDFAAIFAILTLILVPLIAKPGPIHLFKLICILLLSVGLYHILRCKVRLLYCFLLNCFIFPLDPLPLLAAFKDIHFNTIPDFIVFGESLLIDTISLILYHFMGNTYTTVLRPSSLGNIVECLLAVGVEGTATGLLLSCLASIVGNVCRPSTIYFLEFAVIAVLVCLIYFSLQLFQLPAILGVIFCGISIKQYVQAHLSRRSLTSSKGAVSLSLKTVSCVCEALVLLFLLSVDTQAHCWNSIIVFFCLFLCINYTSLGGINFVWWPTRDTTIKLSKFEQFIMFYSILRGLYTFGLVLFFSQTDLTQSQMMIPSILTFTIFVTFILSLSFKPMLNSIKRPKSDIISVEKTENHLMKHIFIGIKAAVEYFEYHVLREGFHQYNSKLLQNILMRDHDLPTPSERRLRLLQLVRKLNLRTWLQHVTTYGGANSSPSSSAPSAAAAAIGAFTCAQASLAIKPSGGSLPSQPRRVITQNSSSATSSNSKLSAQKKSLYRKVLSSSATDCQSLKPLPSTVDQERCCGEDSGVIFDDHSDEEDSSHLTSSSAIGACCGSTSCTEGTKFEDDCRIHHILDHSSYHPRHKWSKLQKNSAASRQSNYAIFHQELCTQLEKLCSNHSPCKDDGREEVEIEEDRIINQQAVVESSEAGQTEKFLKNLNDETDDAPRNYLLATPKQLQNCSAEVSGEEGEKWEQLNISTKSCENAENDMEYTKDSLGFRYKPPLPEERCFSPSPVVAGETIAEKTLPWRCSEKVTEVNPEQGEEETLQTLAETSLPWKRQSVQEPLAGRLVMNVGEDEPQAAEFPSWVNNFLYHRLKETGSPYLSPEDTLTMGQNNLARPSIFSVFPNKQSHEEEAAKSPFLPAHSAAAEQESQQVSLPPPWESHNGTECEPLTSPHATNTNIGDKVCSTESMHRLQPPTHHIIIPLTPGNTNESISDLESAAAVDRAALRSPASAPNFSTHWQMLHPNLRDRRHSTSLTEEQVYEEDCLQRVQNWLDNVEPGYNPVDLDYLEPDAEPFFLLHDDDLDETYDADLEDECLEETIV
ncbi:uncharacterized protein LOC115216422 isoform X2 [Octopus sinensis]|uniref:Uncharacterized protein LOC115216422 isoform X2 n=1 Tax=Octopus sinensis TaxID=2607531 RepID=A0A6P7STV4_9MOLL|nr:uncharacterized protein LOC115216422 isoform X2 [Octopus sinensis]